MTTHDDSPTTRLLRDLDAADRELSPPQRGRAALILERILATEPEPATPATAPTGRPRIRSYRLLLAGGVVTAAAAVVVGPVVLEDSEAFASWSPTPVELTGARRAAAVDACLVLQDSDVAGLAFDPDADASVMIAEARGGWSYVVFQIAGASGRELQGSCLVPDALVADPRAGEGGFFGGLGGAEETAGPLPARDVIREDASGVGAVDGGIFVYAEGRAGRDVVGIEVTTPSGVEVEASLDNGHWAVWWPVGDDSQRSPDVREAPTYEVTLRDGTRGAVAR